MGVAAEDDLSRGFDALLGLGSKLQSLPDAKFLAVIEKLEAVSALASVDDLMDQARPRLRALKPHRPPSLKRILCLPCEDLLSPPSSEVANSGWIGRSAISALWTQLAEQDQAELSNLQAEFAQTPVDRPRTALEIGERIWRMAAKLLAVTAPFPGIDAETTSLLKDIFTAADEIEAFKRAHPRKPILKFGDAEKIQMKEHLQTLAEKGLATRGYLLAAAVRLLAPSELVKWLRDGERAVPAEVERFSLSKLTGQIDDFDRETAKLAPENLAGLAQDLLAALDLMEQTTGAHWRRDLAERTTGLKEKIGHVLKVKIIDTAPSGIAAALTNEATRDVLVAAEAHARALAKARKSAGKIGLSSAANNAVIAIRRDCVGRIDDLLTKKRPSSDPAVDYARMRVGVFQSVRMIELVEGAAAGREVLADAQRRLKAFAK